MGIQTWRVSWLLLLGLILPAKPQTIPVGVPPAAYSEKCLWKNHAVIREPRRNSCTLPVDDESPPRVEDPWTHVPLCINSTSVPLRKYCVYTNSQYGHLGISIITTPQVAATSLQLLEGTTDPLDSAQYQADADREARPYEIVEVAGKGKGVVATRPIAQYETIMTDRASLMADIAFPGRVKQAQGYRLLHRAADQLSEPGPVFGLGRSSNGNADIIEDVMRTNSFNYDLAGVPHMALFPLVSRINHACKPR
jgi:hypothetical protein